MVNLTSVFQVFWIKDFQDPSLSWINVWSSVESPTLETFREGSPEYLDWSKWIESKPEGFEVVETDTNTTKATRIKPDQEAAEQEVPEPKVPTKSTRKGKKNSSKVRT